ncbi:hypothetical protein CJ030_MR8G015378 [Morella rubra]|uniref:Bms1-type G domain-containing protein n=1 Tax=Morella rubra TaxID=262757 RepID=A0A6A1UT37_9ROSI|nr:hypothetical protein CJ030_MR8G015378 [Morella rubra]
MGGSRVQVNKAHKTRFSSKSSRNLHKTSVKDKSRIAKSERNVAKGARAARLQHNRMVREQKRAAFLKEKRATSGSTCPPRVIVLFGLSASVNVDSLAGDLLSILSKESPGGASSTVASSEYKLRTTVLKAPHGDLLSCMEMVKVADLIAFVASASSPCEENTSCYIDSFGSQCLSVFRSLGLPSTVVLIRDLPSELKRKHDSKKMCMSSLSSEFPEDFCVAFQGAEAHSSSLEKSTALRHGSKGAHLFLYGFSNIVIQLEVDMVVDDCNVEKCTLIITGYLRAHSLSVNQLVHISGAGDYQMSKTEILKDPFPLNPRKEQDIMDSDEVHGVEVIRSLAPDPLKQEPLLVENVPDPLAGEQTWPTEAEMDEADRNQKQKMLRKRTLPPGTSEYQAAWIVDDSDVEDSDSYDEADHGMVLDEQDTDFPNQEGAMYLDPEDDQGSLNLNDTGDETDVDSMMMDGENLTQEQIADEIQKIKNAHAEDEEFPDEVDTPLDTPARRRFAKYRGLKSFRTSSWDPKVLLNEYQESLPPIKKHDTYSAPIKAKEELLFHVGFRQFIARPIFSSDNINSDKYKMERFLHPGRFSVASIYAPICFPSLPLVVLKSAEAGVAPSVAAVGSLKSIDPDRIILKKIILTGYPQRVSKLKATVRYMFHHPEDVRWFKPVEVWSKCGRRGRIKEPVGTHGAMKCVFNGILQQHDTVCIYKTLKMMHQDGENLTQEQIADEIQKIKNAHAEDEEFPDEVDTPLDTPARRRFAKYRGLKSFRTSSWDPKESLPPEYARIFAFDNFARTQKHVLSNALDMEQENRDDCIPTGSYISLHIKEVPNGVACKLCSLAKTVPVVASGLLRHESKMSVLHFSIKKHDTYSAPIKAKEELLFHVGFRQFIARPIFSSDNINSDKYKMERFLHPGRFSVASIYAPICFPSLPLVVLKSAEAGVAPSVAAVGSLKSIDPDRIILKKIILTGYPQRVSKLKATVRYMFHHPEDVRWFKPVEVWSKCGRRGRIKEPVGTHGAMKCVFNGILQQHDTVCMSLYKRAYPKWPDHRFPILDA